MKAEYITRTLRTILAALAALLLMPACSDENTGGGEKNDGVPLQLATLGSHKLTARTRTLPSSDYEKYGDLYPQTDKAHSQLGIFRTQTSENGTTLKQTGVFSYLGDNKWSSTVNVRPGNTYYIYGFMPTINANPEIYSADYSQGATITLKDFSVVSAADVCVITGVKKGTDATVDITDPSVDIKEGEFEYVAADSSKNFIYVLLDHIYNCVNVEFTVDAEYDKLRTIKIKSIVMETEGMESADMQIEMQNTSDPIKNLTFIHHSGATASALLLDEEKELSSTTVTNVPAYYTPDITNMEMSFITTYDVYDKKGNLVRKDCKATNKWTATNRGVRGDVYTIKALVKPTYLYQLSEPDLDNPTITLN